MRRRRTLIWSIILVLGTGSTGAIAADLSRQDAKRADLAGSTSRTLERLSSVMSRFAGPRTAADDLDASASKAYDGLIFGDTRLQKSDARLSRHLINAPTGGVFVIPNAGGMITLAASNYAAATRILPSSEHPVVFGAQYKEFGTSPLLLFGVAIDDVASIDVAVDGQITTAALSKDGWYWQADDPAVTLDEVTVVAQLKDGTSVDVT